MAVKDHRLAKARRTLFRKLMVFALFAFSTLAFASNRTPANNSSESASGINADANAVSVQLGQNEARMVITKDGKVLEESTFQLEEVDIIIQFDGEPVLARRNATGADKLARLNDLKLKMNQLKSQVVQAENAVLAQNGKASRQDRDIVKKEYFGVFYGVAARVQKDTIKNIEKISEVKKVWRDGQMKALDDTSNHYVSGVYQDEVNPVKHYGYYQIRQKPSRS